MNRDQADRAGIIQASDPFDHLRLAEPQGPPGKALRAHQLSGSGPRRICRINDELGFGAPVGGDHPAAAGDERVDPEDLARHGSEPADGVGLVGALSGGLEPRQHPLPFAQSRKAVPVGGEIDLRELDVLGPLDGPAQHLAVGVGSGDLDDGDPGQGAGFHRAGSAADMPLALERTQDAAERGAGGAGDAEGAGDVPPAHAIGALADEPKDVVFAGQRCGRATAFGHGMG